MKQLRVLSVGCCDAGIEMWLHEQLGDRAALHVDGLDLDRNMIASAAARAKARGIPGEWKLGGAEQAPDLFPQGSYDVVVAFELIEHVIDPDAFLDALEAMLAPGGRIYLSTPNGTFGEGGNPHHLRAYSATQLAEQVRRHGHLQDMLAGEDGVVSCSYTPARRRGEVAIYCGPGWETWSPMDIVTRGLGGSETAAVRLAEQLDALGFLVTVYGQVQETCYRSVVFKHHERFDPLEPRDALIVSRQPHVFDRPVRAKRTVLWLHDTDCGPELTEKRASRIDHVAVLSEWHERHVAGLYPFLGSRVVRVRNGILRSMFEPLPWKDRAPRALYTSSPDRGLDVLLELWPQIRERVPDAELAFCYAEVYQRVADADPRVAAFRERITALADQPGVEQLPSQPQQKLAQLMGESRVWAHPSWASLHDQPFHETSCIGAMEAQAAGCHVACSSWGALKETVRHGHIVTGDGPGDETWRAGLVEAIVEGLSDPGVGAQAVRRGPQVAADLGWDGAARLFEPLIDARALRVAAAGAR